MIVESKLAWTMTTTMMKNSSILEIKEYTPFQERNAYHNSSSKQ